MKASELRIGNWVYYNFGNDLGTVIALTGGRGTEKERVSIGVSNNSWSTSWFTSEIDEIKPIPLTEEWLKKFGFKKGATSDYNFKQLDDEKYIAVNKENYEYECIIAIENLEDETNSYLPHIKYVHQLQNLYFALTGEELTIKE
jgi:hypothetical protein